MPNKIVLLKNTNNMKKILLIISIFVMCLYFSGCNSFNKKTYSLDDYVANEISKIENYEKLSDETINCLSIIYRTNLAGSETNISAPIDEILLKKVNLSKGKILPNKLRVNTNSKNWRDTITKASLLEFFKSQNITLANLSDIKIVSNENGFTSNLEIASNSIDFLTFANFFHLPSNKNINISATKSIISISGYGNTFNYDIDVAEIKKMTTDGKSINEIFDFLCNF